ncbi:MAG: hypothetical protein JST82_04780 [Bacteroidetes bacterium]|nr:hypothetical protein [Bacteroidota bacterium]
MSWYKMTYCLTLKRVTLACVLLIGFQSFAQNQSPDKWWEDKHHWNGITPWINFMELSSKYMGPNGMPVPDINNGVIPEHSFFEAGVAAHTSDGDKTVNGFLNAIFKAGDRAALGLYFVPYELYNMDTNTSRNIRNTRDYDGKGNATGDVYINGHFQIIKNKAKWPDILLSFGVKTASGGNLEAARYTDAPGYYFGLSFGKTYKLNNSFIKSLRWYIQAGAYMWQTYRADYRQDDSPWFGGGLTASTKGLVIDEQVSGYNGYILNGDQPIINKFSVKTNWNRLFNWKLLLQYGIRDYDYKSVMFSTIMDLSKIKLKKHKLQ